MMSLVIPFMWSKVSCPGGHKLVIYDAYGNEVGMVVQRVLTFLPKFEIYKNGSYIGCLNKEISFLTPHYNIDYDGYLRY